MTNCAVCQNKIEREDAPVISMGFGNPRFICEDCESDFETATLSQDTDEIAAAMDRIGAKLSATDPDVGTYKAVDAILKKAASRARKIQDGEYDFSLDEAESEELTEIPEELCETEEDRILDEKDRVKNEKFDKVFNYFAIGAIAAVVGFLVYRLLDIYFF